MVKQQHPKTVPQRRYVQSWVAAGDALADPYRYCCGSINTIMINDPVTILEERFRALELKVFGGSGPEEGAAPVVDSLLDSDKVVSAALSGRDKMVAAVKSLDRLEAALDPIYEDSVVDGAAKLAYVFSMEGRLEEIARQLVRLYELAPGLESNTVRALPQLTRELEVLAATTAEQQPQFDRLNGKIDELIARYADVINGVTALLNSIDLVVTDLETRDAPKPVFD